MEKLLAYLESALVEQYLVLLPSRWAALLPRMAKRTQRLQTTSDIAAVATLEKELAEDFQLATQLLVLEHALYQDGIALVNAATGAANAPVKRTWDLLAQDILVELTMKEMMAAHWETSAPTIASDTLRVYSHALLVHSRVSKGRVEHLVELVMSSK